MPIQTIIDGIAKTVVQPEVNIDGTWREVNVVSHNINGIWRKSFNRNIYKIKLYRYGVLYDTLSVQKGSSVTLPSVATVQNDDIDHYGWATNPTATTRNYSATQTITPTGDMNLYAVYSYCVMTTITKQAGYSLIEGYFPEQAFTSFPVTIEVAGTISYKASNITQASVPGVGHKTGSAGVALQGTTDSEGLFTNASITVNGKNLTGVFEDGSDPLTYPVSVGDVIGASGYQESTKSENSYGEFDIYYKPIITVTYPALQEQIKYRASI